MSKEHSGLLSAENPFQSTILNMATPAHADKLAVLIINKDDPGRFLYKKLDVQGKKIRTFNNGVEYHVDVKILPLQEVFVDGPLDQAVQNVIDTEADLAKSDNSNLRSLRSAVGTVEYTGMQSPPLDIILQFAGIHFHRERENYKIRQTFQA